jgi:hypothetical protein
MYLQVPDRTQRWGSGDDLSQGDDGHDRRIGQIPQG